MTTKIRSRVISAEMTKKWSYQTFLVPHEMFRMLDDWMTEYVVENSTFDPAQFPWKVTNFTKFWKTYYKALHHHHDIEEEICFPYFKKFDMPVLAETLDAHVSIRKHTSFLYNVFFALDFPSTNLTAMCGQEGLRKWSCFGC